MLVIVIGLSTTLGRPSWSAFYYTHGDLTSKPLIMHEFKDLQSCLSWAEDEKENLNDPLGSYECGKGCKMQEEDFYICKETIDN